MYAQVICDYFIFKLHKKVFTQLPGNMTDQNNEMTAQILFKTLKRK